MKQFEESVWATLPLLPKDAEGPVFAEPWQAQAFALTLKLYEAGSFTWSEWAECLGSQIKAAQQAGDLDLGDTYYHHWLSALEHLSVQKGLVSDAALKEKRRAWGDAAASAAHGQPITLSDQ